MKQTCWHWPDHVIGKRESRRLREEHNALADSHHELMAALDSMIFRFEHTAEDDAEDASAIDEAIATLTKAKEVGHDS